MSHPDPVTQMRLEQLERERQRHLQQQRDYDAQRQRAAEERRLAQEARSYQQLHRVGMQSMAVDMLTGGSGARGRAISNAAFSGMLNVGVQRQQLRNRY